MRLPAHKPKTSQGAMLAATTAVKKNGLLVTSRASSGRATNRTPSARLDSPVAATTRWYGFSLSVAVTTTD